MACLIFITECSGGILATSSLLPSLPMTDLHKGLHGYCTSCGREHSLPEGDSKRYCLEMMRWLEQEQTLDYLSSDRANPHYSTSTLFTEARGKMFGVLEGVDARGNTIILYGFSGQYNGCWNIPGWAPPLFDEALWHATVADTEKVIKAMGKTLQNLPTGTLHHVGLKQERRQLSQHLMFAIHKLYHLNNFRGESTSLPRLFIDKHGVPTGTGDCCAPKLLQYAQQNNIVPRGISEFYWGRENRSGNRQHAHFYPACSDKCAPLMGFMLCGLEELMK
jgi:hypothetical protein